MPEPNAAILDVLRDYFPWNFVLTTTYQPGQAVFDDELASTTTYQVKAVNLLDHMTTYTTSVSTSLKTVVDEMEAWLATRGDAKYATVNGQAVVRAYATAVPPGGVIPA